MHISKGRQCARKAGFPRRNYTTQSLIRVDADDTNRTVLLEGVYVTTFGNRVNDTYIRINGLRPTQNNTFQRLHRLGDTLLIK